MNKKFRASSIRLKATCDKGKDKHFVLELDHLSKFGLITITLKAYPIVPNMALITFWDHSFEFASGRFQIGDPNAYAIFDILISNYLRSPEFKRRREEEGKCN